MSELRATPISVTHVIVRLDTGGAEKSLLRLIEGTQDRLQHRVICFGAPSPIGAEIEALGTHITWLDFTKLGPMAFWQAARVLRRSPPDVLQGWMYLGNVLVSLLKAWLPKQVRVAWNIRNSPDNIKQEGLFTRGSIFVGRIFHPDLVIYNSHAGQHSHADFGFNRNPHVVIPNGIDLQRYQADDAQRSRVRSDYGVGDALWIGMVTRYHKQKRVDLFLEAVALLKSAGFEAKYCLVGNGMDDQNPAIASAMQQHNLSDADVQLLGPVRESADFLPGLDMLVLASSREGTPNILIEALACGVNAVATRVGDVARILLDESRYVPPGDSRALAQCIERYAADEQRAERVQIERAHLSKHYEKAQCLNAYCDQYQRLVAS